MQEVTAHRAKGARLSTIGLAVLLLMALVDCANPARPSSSCSGRTGAVGTPLC